jgi:hypothetical protein
MVAKALGQLIQYFQPQVRTWHPVVGDFEPRIFNDFA